MPELVNVADITIGERYRKDLGDIDALVASIQNVGLISPIAVNADNVLIAGQRRLEAVKRLGWDVVEVVVVDGSQPLASEHDENVVRKDFTPSERKAITDALLEMERPAAAARKREGGRTGGRVTASSGARAPELGQRDLEGRASHIAAKRAGWSRDSHRRFSQIQAAYEAHPDNPVVKEVYEAVERGEMGVKPGQKRLVMAGVLAAHSTELDGKKAEPHMGMDRRSSKPFADRIAGLVSETSGFLASLQSLQREGGQGERGLLEQLLVNLNGMRREVRRLIEGGQQVG